MFRSAALASVIASVLFACPAVAAESATPTLDVASIRPALSTMPETALSGDKEPAKVSLAARLAMAPRLMVKVDISDQTMRVIVDGEERYRWKVSTAGRGYKTPTGVWTPYRMHTMWYSRKYDNAPMPHSIFFTGGYAIHATPYVRRLGTPASHGCVRLHPDHAKELYALAKQVGKMNMRVVIER